MKKLQKLIVQIGWSDAPVLIQGETGVGKEVLARAVHAHSPRARQSLLKLNCAALPSELVESELFGYERGAFTGAFQRKPGMFELADGGTLLLDEIGDMEYKLQSKLLQVLQDQEFQRLGGRDSVRVNVRVIAASHRDLEKAIVQNLFREDLYYRLNVINIFVPPLRERKEDIIPLAEFLIRKHSDSSAEPVQLAPALTNVFLDYHWPGNVRELENTIRKYLILRDSESVELELRRKLRHAPVIVNVSTQPTFPQDGVPQSQPDVAAVPVVAQVLSAKESVSALKQLVKANRDAERAAILAALKATYWNRRQAAVLLEVEYKALLYKMKVLSIKKENAAPDQLRARATPVRKGAVIAIGV
jgi:two-component system response regulator AtoC